MKKSHTWVGLYAGIVLTGCLWAGSPVWAQTTHPMSWGMNANGQASPIPTNTMDDADAIAGGGVHSLALKDGRVWAWGDNTSGQTNVPVAAQSDISAIAAGDSFSLSLNNSGGVVSWGANEMVTGMPVSVSSGVSEIAAGSWHALALKDGEIIAWGSNTEGQCDVPLSLTSGVTAVSAGQYYSMALKDGGVQVFGIPATNELAYSIRSVPNAATSGITAISAGLWHGLALKDDGGVIAWGNPLFDATNVPPEATSNVQAIAAGNLYSMALKTDNTIVLWGAVSTNGGWGLVPLPGFATTGITQVAAGGYHCLTIGPVMPARFIAASLPEAYMDEEYSGFVLAAGDPEVTYYEFGTSWPEWLTLDSMTGDLGGMHETNLITYFSVRASNSIGQVTNSYQLSTLIRPEGPPVFVTTNPLPDGLVNEYYSQQIVVSNNPSFSLVAGGVPEGLTFSTNGLVSGIPTKVEDLFFTVRATNSAGSVSNSYNISIKAPINPPVFVTTNPLPMGVVGEPYGVQIVVSNGATFDLFAGSLPNGLILTSSGMVTGMPTQIDSANFTVQATNTVGSSNQGYDLQIEGPPVFQTTSPLPDGTLGAPYNLQLDVDGDPLLTVVAGALPGGLTLNAVGILSGTPTALGPFNFTVLATNEYGWDNRIYDITIEAIPVFSTTNPLPTGKIAEYYSLQIEASGAPTFSLVAGTLPSGLVLNSAGFLSGVPIEANENPFNFTVLATNAYGSSNRVYDLQIENFEFEPAFTYILGTNGDVWLEWTNANLGGDVQVWSATNITMDTLTWSNLDEDASSPWTNTTPFSPTYYQLRMVP